LKLRRTHVKVTIPATVSPMVTMVTKSQSIPLVIEFLIIIMNPTAENNTCESEHYIAATMA